MIIWGFFLTSLIALLSPVSAEASRIVNFHLVILPRPILATKHIIVNKNKFQLQDLGDTHIPLALELIPRLDTPPVQPRTTQGILYDHKNNFKSSLTTIIGAAIPYQEIYIG